MIFKKSSTVKKLSPTPAVEEGPYYKEGSPERKSIAGPGMPGTKLVLEGHIRDSSGKPIANAWVDFWQADSVGNYDNEGYGLRGHQYTDKEGKYRLETIKPFGYEPRSPHIHVKVRPAPNSPVFTTQLFFAGDEKNATDMIFEELTAMTTKKFKDSEKAEFDFVVETG